MTPRAFLFAWLIAVAGCGGGSTPAHGEPPRLPAPSGSAAVPSPLPGRLSRRDVTATLSRGLGDFLTRLEVEPLLSAGKFHGWRVVKLRPGDPIWAGGALAPGDVVTAVNGRPIERPEQALTAFGSLAVAPELRVSFERDGVRRELAYPIDDEPAH